MEWLFKNEVWKWLVDNREWLFQGIGVVTLGWLGWIVSGPWIGNRKESDFPESSKSVIARLQNE